MELIPIELVALGLLVALGVWALRTEKKLGKTELKKDIAEKTVETLQDINAKIKKADAKFTGKSSADRVRDRKYRD